MKFHILYTFVLFSALQSGFCHAQVNNEVYYEKIDSLISIYQLDEAKDLINESFNYKKSNSNLNFGEEYYRLSIINKKREFNTIALQKVDSALYYFSLEKNSQKSAESNLLKGKIHNRLGNQIKGVNAIKSALETFIKTKDTFNIGIAKMNMGNIHNNMNNNEKSASFYHEAIFYFKQLDLEIMVANCYNNLGNLYRNNNTLDSSLLYYNKSLVIREKTYDLSAMAILYHNYGNLYLENKDFENALFYVNKSIEIKKKGNDLRSVKISYLALGEIYYSMKNYENALLYLKLSLENSDGIYNKKINDSHLLIAKCYAKTRKYKLATFHFNQHHIINDSILNRRQSSSLEKELIKYEIVKDSLVKGKLTIQKELSEIEQNNLELKSKITQNKSNYLFIGLMISLIFGILLFISFKKRLKLSNTHKKTLEHQNEELKRTLISKEEKETLLKEVHHRVKNNLQIINSLIRLQSHYTSPTNYKARLADTENRIRSMALVHEKLYKSADLSKLDSESYIVELVENLMSAFEFNEEIKLDFDIENIKFSIDTLIPLGLIVNEAISNSIKYAFTGLEGGCITLSLEQKEDIILTISDNGIGADLSYEELSEDSLGMELIESLCDQLSGEFTLDTTNGFCYTFIFARLD